MISTVPMMTTNGIDMMTRTIAGEKMTVTRFAIGSGLMHGGTTVKEMQALIDEKLSFEISNVENDIDGYARITGSFNTNAVTSPFRWSEIGLFAKMEGEEEKLYCYGNAGDKGETLVPGNGSSMYVEQQVVLVVSLGNLANVSISVGDSGLYATKEALNRHVQDMDNPHQTTAEQVGLGNVENASPADGHVYFTDNATSTNIKSGDTLGTIVAKIKSIVGIFSGHMTNTGNPHSVTLQQVLGGGSGVVPITNGGTGATTAAGARTNLEITPANIGASASSHTHTTLATLNVTGALTKGDKNVIYVDSFNASTGVLYLKS